MATCVLHNRVILNCHKLLDRADSRKQLLRLHRPFLLKGLSDPKYTYSVEQCTKSARSLCEALVAVVQAHRLDAFWYLLGQTLGAIIVIFIEQFYKSWAISVIPWQPSYSDSIYLYSLDVTSQTTGQHASQSRESAVLIASDGLYALYEPC